MNKKRKILLFCLLGLLVLILLFYSIARYKFSKGSAISRLQGSIAKNDARTAASLIKSSDSKLKIDEKNIKSFLSYLNKNPDSFRYLMDTLHKQETALGSKKDPDCWNFYLTLKKSDKGFLGFHTYYFEMKPCYVKFATTYPCTKLYVDNQYILTYGSTIAATSEKYGPFVQGEHNVRAVLESTSGTSKESRDYIFVTAYSVSGKAYDCECNISMSDKFARIYCEYNDAEVFINGKDIGKFDEFQQAILGMNTINFTDLGQKLIGPIKSGTSIKVYAEEKFPWGSFKSPEYTVDTYTDTLYVSINPVNDEILKQLKEEVAEYNRNVLCKVLKSQSTDIPNIETPGNGLSVSDLLKKEYNNMSSKGIYFTGNYLYSNIDSKNIIITYNYKSKTYSAGLTSTDYYTQNYGDGEDSIIKTSISGTNNNYFAAYDSASKKWKVGFSINENILYK